MENYQLKKHKKNFESKMDKTNIKVGNTEIKKNKKITNIKDLPW